MAIHFDGNGVQVTDSEREWERRINSDTNLVAPAPHRPAAPVLGEERELKLVASAAPARKKDAA